MCLFSLRRTFYFDVQKHIAKVVIVLDIVVFERVFFSYWRNDNV